MPADFYDLMGLPRDATPEEIRNAYFDAARKYHPDANPDPAAKERFIQIQQAYEVLSDDRKRSMYDRTLPADIYKPAISINVKYSRSAIPLIGERQLIYALVDFNCSADYDPSNLSAINLCLVIDRSTSMQGNRIEMVKANVAQLLRQLRPHDVVSIISFSDRAEVLIPPTKIADYQKYENRIHLMEPRGATEIYQGLEAGVTLLRNSASRAGIRQLVLITDGHTYGDENACYELARQAAAEGINISAMGIGHEWNDAFLDKLTGISGSNTVFATSPKDLYNYLDQKLTSIIKVYARGMKFAYESDPLVESVYAFRITPDLTPLPLDIPLQMGNVQFGKSLSVIFEFALKPIAGETHQIQLAKGNVTMEVPSMGQKASRLILNINRPVLSDLERESPPKQIVDAISRLTLYRMQEKARSEVERGDIGKATQHLQHLATHLLAAGERELAHTVLMEAEHIKQSHHFSQDGDKRIKYGTRALFLLPGPEQSKT